MGATELWIYPNCDLESWGDNFTSHETLLFLTTDLVCGKQHTRLLLRKAGVCR